jgi:putative Holliday junction resolvase
MIDQVAAVGILQNWLDQRRAASRTRGAGLTDAAHGEVGDD